MSSDDKFTDLVSQSADAFYALNMNEVQPYPSHMTNKPTSDLLPVEQVDREAAADLAAQFQKYTYVQIEAPAIRRGEHDNWELVQAFARHRLCHTPDPAGLREALEAETISAQELADSELALQMRVELLSEALEFALRLIDAHDSNAKADYGRPLFDTVVGIMLPTRDGSRITSIADARLALNQDRAPKDGEG